MAQYMILQKGSTRNFKPIFKGFENAPTGRKAIEKMMDKDKRMGRGRRISKSQIYYAIPNVGKFQYNGDGKGNFKKPR